MSVIDDINAGKMNVPDKKESIPYTMTTFLIDECRATSGGDATVSNQLVKGANKDQVFLVVTCTALDGEGKGFKQDIAGGLLTRRGDIACYPATEQYPKGTFLFDLKEAINAVKPLKEYWMDGWKPTNFNGLKFKMNAKYIEKANVLILETSYQKVRDQKYLEDHQSQDKTEQNYDHESEPVDPDSLPF